jgi:hypothetical protein
LSCQVNPEKRLGCGPGAINEIKAHRWFSRINWDALAARQLSAPIQPRLKSLLDTSNFDNFDDADMEGQVAAVGPGPAGQDGKGAAHWDSWQWITSLPQQRQQQQQQQHVQGLR